MITPFWLVIPAAGVGARMQADRPKQYLTVQGKTLLELTLAVFLGHPALQGIVVCIGADDPYWPTLPCAQHPKITAVNGGAERADSVLAGLRYLQQQGIAAEHWVLVHDAARPNLQQDDLNHLLTQLADDAVGGLLALPARDTLKQVGADGRVQCTLDRSRVWQALTPQMFRLAPLSAALQVGLQRGDSITDEASAMEHAGLSPRLVAGRGDNIKVTQPEDLQWFSERCAAKTRV